MLEIIQLQEKLLEWYDHTARILPWRDQPTPYRVWVSEIMLQQTRVATVKPYYERFMKEVPTLQDLASISEEKLLKLWEGLGYYSRAKNLRKAACMVVEEMEGVLPSNSNDLKTLPGVGPYTSGAIASIAFGERSPAIDGNVIRVIARVTANHEDIRNLAVKKEIESVVKQLLPNVRVGDFNQALMELGATICIPSGMPRCTECPIHFLCEGYKSGVAEKLPIKSKNKQRKIEEKTIFLINFEDTIALRKRPSKGLLSNLWEFPNVEGYLSYVECEKEMQKWNLSPLKITPLSESKHVFTHIEWQMIGYYITVEKIPQQPGFTYSTLSEIERIYSIPSAFKKYQRSLSKYMGDKTLSVEEIKNYS